MFAQESVMDIQKEREAFEAWYRKEYDNTVIDDSEFSEILDEYESNYYWVDELNQSWKAWQAAKTQAVPEGFVLIKDDTKTVVAIERMVEQQVEASGMDSRRLERLDGWKIIEAAVKTQGQK